MFFEASAKNGENVNKMMYSCIAELPFFEQFQFRNKDDLIKELEGGNKKMEQQNSIYDIVKDKKIENQLGLNINGQEQKQNNEAPGVIVIKRKKKGCC